MTAIANPSATSQSPARTESSAPQSQETQISQENEANIARRAMINGQLRVSGVNEGWVLERMENVNREDYVPPHAKAAAYGDRAIALNVEAADDEGGRTDGGKNGGGNNDGASTGGIGSGGNGSGGALAAPLFYANLLKEAAPKPDDIALIVHGGSAYLPDLLRPLVAKIVVISPEEALKKSRKSAAYSLLLIDGAAEHLPASLTQRLAPNARIVTGIVKTTRSSAQSAITALASGRVASNEALLNKSQSQERASGASKDDKNIAMLTLAEMGIPRLSAFDLPRPWEF